jgi:hypothetical protein
MVPSLWARWQVITTSSLLNLSHYLPFWLVLYYTLSLTRYFVGHDVHSPRYCFRLLVTCEIITFNGAFFISIAIEVHNVFTAGHVRLNPFV